MRRTVKETIKTRASRGEQVPQTGLREKQMRLQDQPQEAHGWIFKIRPILFLKSGGMELPRVVEPLDSSKASRDLQRT